MCTRNVPLRAEGARWHFVQAVHKLRRCTRLAYLAEKLRKLIIADSCAATRLAACARARAFITPCDFFNAPRRKHCEQTATLLSQTKFSEDLHIRKIDWKWNDRGAIAVGDETVVLSDATLFLVIAARSVPTVIIPAINHELNNILPLICYGIYLLLRRASTGTGELH